MTRASRKTGGATPTESGTQVRGSGDASSASAPKKKAKAPAGQGGFERAATSSQERTPYKKATPAEKESLVALRTIAKSDVSYDQGSLHIRDDGTLEFLDLTMEQVPLAQAICMDEKQQARLAEFRVDWPGGADDVFRPASYVALAQSGELKERIDRLKDIRDTDKYGVFRKKVPLRIGGKNLNVGEEREISGVQGSGTVYFSSCSMACSFCQYADIAHMKGGDDIKVKELAETFLDLQDRGAHNIQLMTPSHFIVEILEAVQMAADQGLKIPLVYNTGGYEDLDALKELDGIVDVYLPDVKFGNNDAGQRYGGTKGYWDNVQEAVREMHRQVGDLKKDDRGVAYEGLLVRHLIMPDDVTDSGKIADFLASVSKDMRVHLMDQWTPTFTTFRSPEIDRPVTAEEVESTQQRFKDAGLAVVVGADRSEYGV
ncbi:MAG: radical SAM protein [Deltaproteobacteria bacterium]